MSCHLLFLFTYSALPAASMSIKLLLCPSNCSGLVSDGRCFELLLMAAEEHPKLNNPRDLDQMSNGQSDGSIKSGIFVYIDLCDCAPSWRRVTTSGYLERIFYPFTQILHRLIDRNLCWTFWCKSLHSTVNGSKFIMCKTWRVFFWNTLYLETILHSTAITAGQYLANLRATTILKNLLLGTWVT